MIIWLKAIVFNILKKESKDREKFRKNEVKGYKLSANDTQRKLHLVPWVLSKTIVIRKHDLKDHTGVLRTSARNRKASYIRYLVNASLKLFIYITCIFSSKYPT